MIFHDKKQLLNIIFTEKNLKILSDNLIEIEKKEFSLSELKTIALSSFQIYEKDFQSLRRIVKRLLNDYISRKTNLTNFLILFYKLKNQNNELIANFSEKSLQIMENLNNENFTKFNYILKFN